MPSSDQPVIFLGMPAIIRSEAMRKLMDTVERVASSDATVLITGETGTGKELISRAIHHHSLRCHQPWVDVNCATLPEHLVESELFGHEKGAFSGADSMKPGLFELAHKGTLFLDEIGELEPKLQVKLLRILDGVPYYRVGGRKKVAVDVRVVAATNREMSNEVGAGQFRRDLYHRLSQIHVQLPPLRERLDDILPLAEFFLYEQNPQGKLSAEAKNALCCHAWPGNIRELRNVMMRAATLATQPLLEPSDLGLNVQSRAALPEVPVGPLEGVERNMIERALTMTGGHQQQAAKLLGISRRTLSRKLKRYESETAPQYSA